ncbi:hypothetical protein ACS0TY_035613 [Phlomoides rotata]
MSHNLKPIRCVGAVRWGRALSIFVLTHIRFGGNTKSKFENGDVIFNDASDNSSGIVDRYVETHFEDMDLVLEEELMLKWALKKPEFKFTTGVLDLFVRVKCAHKMKREGKAIFDVFSTFEEFGCVCNADTYYLTIEIVCRKAFNNWAQLVYKKMLSADLLLDAEKEGKIITCAKKAWKKMHI